MIFMLHIFIEFLLSPPSFLLLVEYQFDHPVGLKAHVEIDDPHQQH